jgi:hypothetical protein
MPDDKGAGTVEELAVLAAKPRRVEVYTLDKETDEQIVRKIRVAPMTLDICGDVASALREIVENLGPAINAGMVPQIIAEHKDAARAIIAAATEQTEEYIGSLPADQALFLGTIVWEVNQAFFRHRVGPMAKALADKMFGGAGLTLSNTSQSTDTPTP